MRCGCLGAGRIAPAYLELARHFPDVQVAAIADNGSEKAAEMARRFGGVAMSVDDMLAEQGIETIVNLTPIPAHDATNARILEAGKHLYCEKPFASSLAAGRELLAMAEASGLTVAAAPDTFLGAAWQRGRALLDSGAIGEPVSARARLTMDGRRLSAGFFGEEIGPLRELGPYYLTALVALLGPVARVGAIARAPFPNRTVAGAATPLHTKALTSLDAIFGMATGVTATLALSVDGFAQDEASVEIIGTDGSLLLPDPNFFGGGVVLVGAGGTRWSEETGADPLGRENWQGRTNYRSVGIADMAAAMRAGGVPRASARMALHIVEIIERIFDSAASGRFEELETACECPEPLGTSAERFPFDWTANP